VFWSGYQIEERNWHLYWIQSYTSKGVVGLDATVDEDAGLDLKFVNPTKNHLLIQSWVDSSSNINFALYGTRPDWVVKVDPPAKTDVVPADSDSIFIEEEPTMPEGNRLQVERATDGFVVTHLRHVIQDGNDRTLRLTSRYRPSRNVVLVGTGGKPPSRGTVVESNKPAAADEKPVPTPATSVTAVATAVPQPTASTAPVSVPPAAPAAAPTTAPVRAPTAPPVVVPTAKPLPPTPTPGRGR